MFRGKVHEEPYLSDHNRRCCRHCYCLCPHHHRCCCRCCCRRQPPPSGSSQSFMYTTFYGSAHTTTNANKKHTDSNTDTQKSPRSFKRRALMAYETTYVMIQICLTFSIYAYPVFVHFVFTYFRTDRILYWFIGFRCFQSSFFFSIISI